MNPSLFIQETRSHILRLERKISALGARLPTNPSQSEKHFRAFLQTQSQLAALTIDEANIRAKITSIQATLTPHMEILHKELGYVENLPKKDLNLSTLDGLVQLVVDLIIQIKSLDVACDNWDASLKIILDVHKSFLDKHRYQNFEATKQRGSYQILRLT